MPTNELSALVIDGQNTFQTIKDFGLFKSVFYASKLSEALNIIRKQEACIIFTDSVLSESKKNIIKTLKNNCDECCIIIVLTDKDFEREEKESIENGADDFLDKKEMSENEIMDRINFSINKKKARHTLKNINQKLMLLYNGN